MAAMRVVGNGHALPPHAQVREGDSSYLIGLNVPTFSESELTVDLLGRALTVKGEHVETTDDEGKAFRLRERLTESFRLPDDADLDRIDVHYEHGALVLEVPRARLERRRLAIRPRSGSLIHPGAEPC
jgi:HSP20 family protein